MLFFIILFKNSKELMKVFLLTSLALLALLVLSTSSVDAQGGACITAADCLNTALPHDYAGGPHSLCVSRLVFSSFWYV